jgi:hypothetical protein
MNCKQARNRDEDAVEQSTEVTRHLEHCAECRLFFEEKRWMQDCLALARLERPDDRFEARLMDAVHRSVRTRGAEPVQMPEKRIEWVFPAWRWAAAASFVLALGAWVTIHQPGAGAGGVSSQPLQSASPVIDFQKLLPAAAFPDPSPPSAAAGSFSLADSNRTDRTNLVLIRFEP